MLMYMQASCLLISFSSPPDAPWARRGPIGSPEVRPQSGQTSANGPRASSELRQVGEVMEAHAARAAGHGAAEPAFNPAGAVPPGV